MSLINEMLRDLEARRAGELAKPDLQREVRPLPSNRRGISLWAGVLAGGVVLAVAAGGLSWWRADLLSLTESFLTQSPTPEEKVAPTPPPTAIVATEQPLDAVVEALRLAVSLENPPLELAPRGVEGAATKAAPTVSPGPREEPALSPRKEVAPTLPKPPESAAALTGSVEKSVVLATPREKADAELRRAQSLLASGGQHAAAAEILQGALRHDPTYSPARQVLVKVLLETRRTDEAVGVLQEGLDAQPAQTGWALSLARLLVERGDLTGAERNLARSRPYGEAYPEYAGFHGHLLNRLGRHREAADLYLSATRQAPGDGRWWFGLGQALEGSGRAEEGKAAFRRALDAGNLNADLTTLAEQKTR